MGEEILVSPRLPILGPSQLGPELRAVLAELTGANSDQWARAAAEIIRRYVADQGRGPTFGDLFGELAMTPDLQQLSRAANFPQPADPGAFSVMHHVAVHWRRSHWISWSHSSRSLRPGARFSAEPRRQREGQAPEPQPPARRDPRR
jgi:hypothetical protein